ncbi:MAG: hypothetical protein Q9216_006488, partial [Gyalolechia sp. 2 TL-2023]
LAGSEPPAHMHLPIAERAFTQALPCLFIHVSFIQMIPLYSTSPEHSSNDKQPLLFVVLNILPLAVFAVFLVADIVEFFLHPEWRAEYDWEAKSDCGSSAVKVGNDSCKALGGMRHDWQAEADCDSMVVEVGDEEEEASG